LLGNTARGTLLRLKLAADASVICMPWSVSNKEAIREFAKFVPVATDADNLDAYPDVFANDFGPIISNTPQGRKLVEWRLRMPSSEFAIGTKSYDSGTTKVRRPFDRLRELPVRNTRKLRREVLFHKVELGTLLLHDRTENLPALCYAL
jgi:hypothetical protein